jgi:hypothetical protein
MVLPSTPKRSLDSTRALPSDQCVVLALVVLVKSGEKLVLQASHPVSNPMVQCVICECRLQGVQPQEGTFEGGESI